MTDNHIDPRAEQTLHLLSRIRGLLDQHERVLRTPGVQRQCNLDLPLRSATQALHYLALSWRNSLETVPVPTEVTPEVHPSVPAPVTEHAQRPTSTHPLAQRILAE